MGFKWLDFLIGALDLVGMWFGEDHKSNHHNDICMNEIGLRLQISITTLQSIVNTNGRISVSSKEINKHALSIR